MTIVTSRMGLVIDNLVTLLKASATFADPVFVSDGPSTVPRGVVDTVYVGFTGAWDAPVETVTIDHGPYYVGNTSVTETLNVNCQILTWSGDSTAPTSTKILRDRALVLMAGVEDVIRTDPTLGIDGGTMATLSPMSVFQDVFEDGQGCRMLFTVTIIAHLSTS